MARNLTDRARQAIVNRNPQTGDTAEVAKPRSIQQYVDSISGDIAQALPKHMDIDRMTRLALTVVRKTPKLAECTGLSLAGSLLTAAALGLEPGVFGECYLVPYKTFDRDNQQFLMECQLIVGYQGFVKLFYQHPLAASLDAQIVYENDDFDYEHGTQPFLRHKPTRGERGQIIYYYAVAALTSGAPRFVVLTPDEVKTLRRGKVGPTGDIADPQRWMEKKTAVRQVIKLLPKSATLAAAVAADERDGIDLYRERLEDVIDVDALTAEPAPDSDPSDPDLVEEGQR